MKYSFYFFLTSLLFLYCTKKDKSINEIYSFKDVYKLQIKNTIPLPLDTVTHYYSRCLQYIDKDSVHILASHNEDKNCIYIYDLDKKINIKIISVPYEGDNGVGQMKGFYIHTLDSIFIPSDNTQAIYLVNSKAKVLNKYKYNKNNQSDFTQIQFTGSNIALINNELYCPTFIQGKGKNATYNQVLNIKTKKWRTYIKIPDSYEAGFFGALNFYMPYMAYNSDKKHFVMSFPIENYIYEYNTQKQIGKHYAGSKYLEDVKPMASSPYLVPFNDRDLFFRKSPSYVEIFYDKYRKLYYRISEQPVPESRLYHKNPIARGTKNNTIIILNENFQKVGEFSLPKFTYGITLIPTKEGVLILNYRKSQKDEENVYYDLFEVVENKK